MAVFSAHRERHQPLERLRERILAAIDHLRSRHPSRHNGAHNGHANTAAAPFAFAAPTLEVEETDDAVLVRAESPGFGPDEVSVEATRDRLVLRGRKQQEHEEHDRGFHRIERQAGEFFRSVILPSEVDPDRATATFRDGVLHVSLPKTEEARARQVRVPVRSS